MAIEKLRGKDLIKMGYPEGKVVGIAINAMLKHFKRTPILEQKEILRAVLQTPEDFINDEALAPIAKQLLPDPNQKKEVELLPKSGEYRVYGSEHIEVGARNQMDVAMRLPVTMAGALMPDAHHGYGLPIGGVLATNNAVIPYGVGVDIGCRMCLSVYDIPESFIDHNRFKLKQWLGDHTRFGMNESFSDPMDDAIFSRPEFKDIKIARELRDRAYKQIGSSGSGNLVPVIDARHRPAGNCGRQRRAGRDE
jgi:tRNA-splicing ligase RtcB